MPNVGKSTLFNALLKKRVALSANYPFATIEPNVGVVAVPDERLAELAKLVKLEEKMENLPPIVPAAVEFVDIAGLVKGASQGAGLGNQFLARIREVDTIVHVVRDFEDSKVVREGSTDPKSDREVVETELALADLQTLEKVQSAKCKVQNDSDKLRIEAIGKIRAGLEKGQMAGKVDLSEKEREAVKELQLLTMKPILNVYNVDESGLGQDRGNLAISAKLEEELADYAEEEKREYLQSVGIQETGLERLIKLAYETLGLISFLTAGPKEVRAWTIRKGTKAPQAAGVIHTDFEKGFIKAQTIKFADLVSAGSFREAKKLGKIRAEGKEYVVQDGDVVEFMFNK